MYLESFSLISFKSIPIKIFSSPGYSSLGNDASQIPKEVLINVKALTGSNVLSIFPITSGYSPSGSTNSS